MELVIRAAETDAPIWAPAKTIRRLYGINRHALYRIESSGAVKSKKLPGGSKAGRIYKVADIESYLEK